MAPSDKPQPALGEAIRKLRKAKNMTQEAAAHDAGITTATLGVIERGLSNPTWATLKGIASALDISVTEIARLAEKLDKNQT